MKKKKTEPEGIALNTDDDSDKKNPNQLESSQQGINTDCCICMTDPIEHPVVLANCRHAFCGPCLISWQSSEKLPFGGTVSGGPKCPVCRTKTDNVVEGIINTARLLQTRAEQRGCSKEDRDHYLQMAVQEVDKAILDSENKTVAVNLDLLMLKADLLLGLRRGPEVLECLDELERINRLQLEALAPLHNKLQEANATLEQGAPNAEALMEESVNLYEEMAMNASAVKPFSNSLLAQTKQTAAGMKLYRARAYECMDEWKKAKDIYVSILEATDDPTEVHPIGMRQLCMGLARCFYCMKDYDGSIAATDAAIDCNRHYPGVYKHKALSQKALGKLDDAIQTMKIAAIYETPWDNVNRQTVIDLHNELVEEKGKHETEKDQKDSS